jgi:hypothetical protein
LFSASYETDRTIGSYGDASDLRSESNLFEIIFELQLS